MHSVCPQSILSKHLAHLGRVVATRGPLPITSHVLVSTDSGRLKLTGTNLDLALTVRLDAEVRADGAISVPARLFADVVAALPDGQVELDARDGSQMLLVKGTEFEARIHGLPASEFPPIDRLDAEPTVQVPAAELAQALEDVHYAAAKDDTRPQFAGVLLQIEGGTLTLTASDQFRLAKRRLVLATRARDDLELIVPARAAAEVARVQGQSEGSISITVNGRRSQVLFKTDDAEVMARVIDGAYANLQAVLGQLARHTVRATMTTEAFQRGTRFTALVSRTDNSTVWIDIRPEEAARAGKVTLCASSAQVGENRTAIAATIEGGDASVALNNAYLTEALTAIHTSDVILSAAASEHLVVLLQPAGRDDALHLIMPLSLRR